MRLDAYRDGVLDRWYAWKELWSNPDANLLRTNTEVFPPGDCLLTLRFYCRELKHSLQRFKDWLSCSHFREVTWMLNTVLGKTRACAMPTSAGTAVEKMISRRHGNQLANAAQNT